mgnify:CR=1 FL=1
MDRVLLVGAEGVQSAARQLRESANDMRRAAESIASENERQRAFLDDWLQRLAGAFEDHATMLRQS